MTKQESHQYLKLSEAFNRMRDKTQKKVKKQALNGSCPEMETLKEKCFYRMKK